MATQTTNFKLPRPEVSDVFNLTNHNDLIDKIDSNIKTELDKKADKSYTDAALLADRVRLSRLELPVGQNLVQNSTFAMGFSGWEKPDSKGSTLFNNSGIYCYLEDNTAYVAQNIPVSSGVNYTLSLKGWSTSCAIDFIYLNSSQVEISRETLSLSFDDSGFVLKTFTKLMPTNTAFLKLKLYSNSTTKPARFSSVKVELGASATPYTNEGDIYELGTPITYTPTLLNGATGSVTCVRVGNILHVAGTVTRGTANTLFTLPFSPAYDQSFGVITSGLTIKELFVYKSKIVSTTETTQLKFNFSVPVTD